MSNVRCWNCGMDFEVPSSAGNTNKPTAQHIEEVLRSNMFDAQRGGTVIMNVDDMLEEVAEILSEYL